MIQSFRYFPSKTPSSSISPGLKSGVKVGSPANEPGSSVSTYEYDRLKAIPVAPRILSPFLKEARGRPTCNKSDDISSTVRGGRMPLSTLDAFKASLDPKDRIIHELATTMLKTRYDPRRSNAYRSFLATQEKEKAKTAEKEVNQSAK